MTSGPETSPVPETPAPRAVFRRAAWIVAAYAGPLCLFLLSRRDVDEELRWHARHGLVLFLGDLAAVASVALLCLFATVVVGGVTLPLSLFLMAILALALLVLHGLVAAAAIEGTRIVVPGVSHHADRF